MDHGLQNNENETMVFSDDAKPEESICPTDIEAHTRNLIQPAQHHL